MSARVGTAAEATASFACAGERVERAQSGRCREKGRGSAMTISVDDVDIPARVGRFSSRWCHLWTDQDDQTELHELATRIGLRRGWFQPGRRFDGTPDPTGTHYDLTAGKRAAAVAAGAVEISRREGAAQRRARRDHRSGPGDWEVALLAAVSAHAPTPLISPECGQGGCEHLPRVLCPAVVVACLACSRRCGGWAGEGEGTCMPECTITAPCEVLRALAAHYRIACTDTGEDPDRPQLPGDRS